MFTYGSVPAVTKEIYSVPKIELAIRIQPQNIVIAPEPGKIPPDSLQWAKFHNGVAAALRIAPSSSLSASAAVDSSWIAFNKPPDLTSEHAGFLFGLGLFHRTIGARLVLLLCLPRLLLLLLDTLDTGIKG